jgi:hypothetical protein
MITTANMTIRTARTPLKRRLFQQRQHTAIKAIYLASLMR